MATITWTLPNEKLPNDGDEVLVTILNTYTNERFTDVADFRDRVEVPDFPDYMGRFNAPRFHQLISGDVYIFGAEDGLETLDIGPLRIIAWAELPPPAELSTTVQAHDHNP